jgi:toxin HigB-1
VKADLVGVDVGPTTDLGHKMILLGDRRAPQHDPGHDRNREEGEHAGLTGEVPGFDTDRLPQRRRCLHPCIHQCLASEPAAAPQFGVPAAGAVGGGPAGDAVVAGGLRYRERERDLPRATGTSLVSCIDTRYAVEVIESFHHKGLERLYRGGSKRGVQAAHVPKVLRILSVLDVAQSPDDLAIPSFRTHPLKGDLAGHWSIWVNGNWRITFRFNETDVELVDYQDYH